ncbi:MAG: alpha/beta hydrolase [Pseudomonadota bacterium]|nr:alpha/beta hydrolase [Pseudomonadota bacterium]
MRYENEGSPEHRIPNSQIKLVDDCGHIPQVEKTDETFDAVMGFLRS